MSGHASITRSTNSSSSRLLNRIAMLCAFLGILSVPVFKARSQSAGIPIEHFVFIIQENHSFDSYFGTYPGANGIPAGTALADFPGGPRYHTPQLETRTHIAHDLPHGWLCYRVAWDNGAMDGFLWAEYPQGYNYYVRASRCRHRIRNSSKSSNERAKVQPRCGESQLIRSTFLRTVLLMTRMTTPLG
jgi:phospholipase C